MHETKIVLRLGVALCCSGLIQRPRLGKVLRPALGVVVHGAKIVLRLGVTLRGSEPKQPPCLGKVFRRTLAKNARSQFAEISLRVSVARYSEPKQPPCLGKVSWPTIAIEAESAAEHGLCIAKHGHFA